MTQGVVKAARRPVIDLFAGPGGWEIGALLAGLEDPLGIEWGDEECATRRAAGLPTLQADVAGLDPADTLRAMEASGELAKLEDLLSTEEGRALAARVYREHGEAGLWGLIASPPCQAWSMAGKGEGRTHDIEVVREAAVALRDQPAPEHVSHRALLASYAKRCRDPRSILVVEPLRWALALNPVWMAWEQVPPVLEFWELCADELRAEGYTVWTGILSAEQYGVPQTRKRAILLAARDGRPVGPPAATHQRYLPPRKLDAEAMGLFDADEFAERRVHPEDQGLLPWVSMAEALGWHRDALVGFARKADDGEAVEIDGEQYRERDLRRASQPAQVVTEKARSWSLHANAKRSKATVRSIDEPAPTITAGHDVGDRVFVPDGLRAGTNANDVVRRIDEPAATLRFGERLNAVDWVRDDGEPPTHYDRRQTGGDGTPVPLRDVDQPAPTMTAAGLSTGRDQWVTERPATTVAGDPRVHPPGHKVNAEDLAAGRDGYEGRAGKNAIRVSIEQAAILQSFPADFPWRGSRSAQYRQVGNAVPPLLGAAVLRSIAAAAEGQVAA